MFSFVVALVVCCTLAKVGKLKVQSYELFEVVSIGKENFSTFRLLPVMSPKKGRKVLSVCTSMTSCVVTKFFPLATQNFSPFPGLLRDILYTKNFVSVSLFIASALGYLATNTTTILF